MPAIDNVRMTDTFVDLYGINSTVATINTSLTDVYPNS